MHPIGANRAGTLLARTALGIPPDEPRAQLGAALLGS
jgi:hypothetical protein